MVGAEVSGGGCSLSTGASPLPCAYVTPSLRVPRLPCSPVCKIVVQRSAPSPTNDVVCDKSYNSSVSTLAVGCVSHGPGAEPRRRCPRGPQGFRPLAPVPTSQAPTWNCQHGHSLYVRAIDGTLLLPLSLCAIQRPRPPCDLYLIFIESLKKTIMRNFKRMEKYRE